MLNIGVTRKTADSLKIRVSYVVESDIDYYLSESKIGGVNCGLIINSSSYYAEIVHSIDIDKSLRSLSDGEEIKFGIITNASLKSRVQTIVSKCASISKDGRALSDVERVLNGIPWKFLGLCSPSELSIKNT